MLNLFAKEGISFVHGNGRIFLSSLFGSSSKKRGHEFLLIHYYFLDSDEREHLVADGDHV